MTSGAAINLVIRFGGISVHTQKLEPGEYTLGRGRHNRIRLHLAMLSRQHGKIWYADGDWWYQDTRPTAEGGRIRLDLATTIEIGSNIELARVENIEESPTRVDHISDIRAAVRAARGGLSMAAKLSMVGALLFVVLGGAGGYFFWKSRQPMDANALLQFAKTKIVEFELPKESKGQQDLRRYAGLKDEDFTDTLGFCTGFIIAPSVVLTANHCLQGSLPFGVSNEFVLKTHDGKQHQAQKLLGFDMKRDFAYIEVPGLDSYGHLDITEASVVGEKVFTIGNVAGEGVAIRDGIMASKTPDQDDPSVEFLRYSAAASPGNSGGPLLNGFGKVVALVFARASLSENYNLGTSGKDLLDAKKRFVEDRSDKKVTVKIKDMMQFRPESLLFYLRIPFENAWRENPESMRPLEEITTEVSVPSDLESFTKNSVDAINAATMSAYEAVASHEANAKARTQRWESFLSDKNRIIIPGQLGTDFAYELQLAADGKQLKSAVQLLTPPCSCSLFGFGGGGQEDDEPKPFEATGIETRPVAEKKAESGAEGGAEATSAAPTNEMRYTSEYYEDGKRPLTMFAFRPIVNVRSFLKPEGDGTNWESVRSFEQKQILKTIVGKEGLLASTESQYVRPKSQREFSIKELDEELKEESLTDGIGRTWKVFSTQIFDNYLIENYCLPLPQGGMCLTSMSMAMSPQLTETSRANFAKYSLTPYLVGPTFWSVDSLVDFHRKKHADNDPVMKDFRLARTKSGALKVVLEGFGIEIIYKAEDLPTMLRLNGGMHMKGDQKSWVAVGHQAYFGEGDKRRICDIGVEIPGTNSVSMLHSYRRKEQYMKSIVNKEAKPKISSIELPKDKFFSQKVTSTKLGTELLLYGYCMPINPGDGDGKTLEVSYFDLKPYKPDFKVL